MCMCVCCDFVINSPIEFCSCWPREILRCINSCQCRSCSLVEKFFYFFLEPFAIILHTEVASATVSSFYSTSSLFRKLIRFLIVPQVTFPIVDVPPNFVHVENKTYLFEYCFVSISCFTGCETFDSISLSWNLEFYFIRTLRQTKGECEFEGRFLRNSQRKHPKNVKRNSLFSDRFKAFIHAITIARVCRLCIWRSAHGKGMYECHLQPRV